MTCSLKNNPYWQAVLAEVLNKANPDYPTPYTNIRNTEALEAEAIKNKRRVHRRRQAAGETRQPKHYDLKVGNRGVVFTQREMQLARELVDGNSLVKAAEHLGLSDRTVEFYSKNMRRKTDCATKKDLVSFLKCSNLAGVCLH